MPASEAMHGAVSGAILAGGRARRFGGADKSALLVEGRTILERQLDLLRRLAGRVFIVGHTPERFATSSVDVVADAVPDAGPLGGLYTALASSTTPLVLVLACDLPLVPAGLLARLVRIAEGDDTADAVVPRDTGGRHPLCACYRARCGPRLAARLRAGRFKVLDALDDLRVVEIGPDELRALDPGGHALANVNTPEDYAALRAITQPGPTPR
jgi:molybdopterin-guanine dinucleotide biosynthesis protein A